jgi:membrane dipeptidase
MKGLSRRGFLGGVSKAAVAAPFVLRRSYRVFAQSSKEYPERVVRLMRESLVIDMLNQFLYRRDQRDLLQKWLTQPSAFTEADFLRFKSSGVNVINFGQAGYSFAEAEQRFANWNNFIAQYPQWLMRINTAADLSKVRERGKFGIIFGLQNGAQFESLDAIDHCYMNGQRVSQLCYNFRTSVADGAFEPTDAGVSEYGGKVIERMNKIGMAVDLGHASDKTKLDALALSKAPVILSHGNCRALNPKALRTATDEAIRKLAAKGGVMGITGQRCLVNGSDSVTIDDVVDHYDHVRDLVGIDHVGVGSDAGIESNDLAPPDVLKDFNAHSDPRYNLHGEREMVEGMEGPARMYELTAALIRRGYTDEHVRLVIGANWARVLGEIWRS